MIHNIPAELRALDQWVCAGPDKLPLNPRTGQAADVTDPSTWGTFAEAAQCGYRHIGFVLSKGDPFSIIDLDDPKTPEQAERHNRIVAAFDTYMELSQSGNGLHIIVRGKIPKGCRRDRVEIYSDSRYMICTGNVFKQMPVADYQSTIEVMFNQMETAAGLSSSALTQIDGHMSDEEIYRMGAAASNCDKFNRLWEGNWQGVAEWPSQSEADFALLSMLAFYTKDNEQVRRLFRYSALGKREKAVKNNKYLDYALSKIRAKELPIIDLSTLQARTDALLSKSPHVAPGLPPPAPSLVEPANESTGLSASKAESGANDEQKRPEIIGTFAPAPIAAPSRAEDLSFPPGFVGRAAEYILASAIRPVPEIALAAAIALTAGTVGRAYNISGTGLNQYLILLAPTGSGKEGAATGIDALTQAVRMQCPMVDEFIGPSAFASGQALIRVLDKQPCFVSVLGEFGLTLQSLCDPNANTAEKILKKVLLDIYAKSGHSKVLRSSVYSESEKNTKVVQAPNVTILGEATPESFYDGLDAGAIAQGLIPRFTIFEYTGPRPARNPRAFHPPGKELVDQFATLLACALAAKQNHAHCPVPIGPEAMRAFDAFDTECDGHINSTRHDIVLQLWNRAHLKALKLAALVAVGVNPYQPAIDGAAAEWAIRIVRRDIGKLLHRFQSGDTGTGDVKMESDARRAILDWLEMPAERKVKAYGVSEAMAALPIIPFAYLRRRLRLLASFREDRRGALGAIKMIITSMEEANIVAKMSAGQAKMQFNTDAIIYTLGENWDK